MVFIIFLNFIIDTKLMTVTITEIKNFKYMYIKFLKNLKIYIKEFKLKKKRNF